MLNGLYDCLDRLRRSYGGREKFLIIKKLYVEIKQMDDYPETVYEHLKTFIRENSAAIDKQRSFFPSWGKTRTRAILEGLQVEVTEYINRRPLV